jgi:type IV pilus assembly protein PilM
MLNTKSFLTVDFGAGSLKLAEFEVNEAGGLRLKQYSITPLGAEGAQETAREAVVLKGLQAVMTEKGIKAKTVNVCAPGFHVFSKFVKLPPVDAGKVTQIIEYEARSNVPFPLEEVVWDYQILGSAPSGELEVLLVAIKADIVEGLFRVTEAAGLHLQLTDVSPAALCNAFRFNYGDLEDCTMLLDIGAKTSNLLFFEKGKVFSRSINLGANSITQDFANESKLKFDKAEKLKIDEGFVSLGGAYEEPENANQAAISKIARQFMTRLHIQVNQTMQFYRGQQGGSAPQRLFLSGGASIMPYTAQFFAEKLNVPVEYFNPLRNVQIDPGINLEELARSAHSMGEVVGLALRNLAHCPVELNLMPDSTLKWQAFNQKKPYFIASVFSLVVGVLAIGFLFDKLATVKNDQLTEIQPKLEEAKRKDQEFTRAYHTDLKKARQDADQVVGWMQDRFYWADVLSELRNVLIRAEEKTKASYRTDTGIWIEQLTTANPASADANAGINNPIQPAPGAAASIIPPGISREQQEMYERRYGIKRPSAESVPAAPVAGAGGAGSGGTNDVDVMNITFRAIGLNSIAPGANADTALELLTEIKNSPYFEASTNTFAGDISQETPLNPNVQSGSAQPGQPGQTGQPSSGEPPGTFSFKIVAKLKRPLKL